jgi:hypothetical protein
MATIDDFSRIVAAISSSIVVEHFTQQKSVLMPMGYTAGGWRPYQHESTYRIDDLVITCAWLGMPGPMVLNARAIQSNNAVNSSGVPAPGDACLSCSTNRIHVHRIG